MVWLSVVGIPAVVGIIVLASVAWLHWSDAHDVGPYAPVWSPVAGLDLQLLFVEHDGGALVLDGLLAPGAGSAGLPVTFRVESPRDEYLAAQVGDVLERWLDGRVVTVDASRVQGARPTIGLLHADTMMRLAVVGIVAGSSS